MIVDLSYPDGRSVNDGIAPPCALSGMRQWTMPSGSSLGWP